MKLLITGSLAVDQIMTFDGLYKDLIQPDKIHTLSISCLVKQLRKTRGGTAGNIAYSLALLGENPILYASIGKESKTYINNLAKLRVNTNYIHYSKLATASFSVLTDKNDCQVGGFYPGAMSDANSLSIERFKDEDVFVVISAHDPAQMAVQVQECRALNKRLFYDIGQQVLFVSKENLLAGLEAAELLIVNDYEMGVLINKTGLSKNEIIRKTAVSIVTLGSKGSEIYAKLNNWKASKVPAIKLNEVVDPTGAGDAFRAGFLYGYSRKWDLKKCTKLGSTIASFVVEKLGTQEHFFTWNEVKKRYQQNYQQELKK